MLTALLPKFDHVVVTPYEDNPRSCPPEELEAKVRQLSTDMLVHIAPDPSTALDRALQLADDNGLVLVTGSVFIGAQCRKIVRHDA